MSIFLSNLQIHPSWQKFFEDERVQKELKEIEVKLLGKQFTPSVNNVVRFATVDIKSINAIVQGKDPYPQQRADGTLVATGRAFEVSNVHSWDSKDINPSLKNILKLLHKSHFNLKNGASIEEVRESIADGSFPILPPNQAFSHWENEGVLFINRAFTCEVGGIKQAGSHRAYWRKFFKYLLAYLATENPKIRYFLWGEAKLSAKPLMKLGIKEELLYLSKHPCTNGDTDNYKRNGEFLNNPCFHETSKFVKWV